ncbi:MAG TPA: PTS transporter subunit EIIC [Vulgatibacter sp.]
MKTVAAGTAGTRARLEGVSRRLGSQRHLLAVRDGVIGALPLVLIGSAFLLLAQPPSAWLQERIEPWVQTILLPYRMLGGLVSLYVCFGTARSLARSHGLDEMGAPLVALASFLVAVGPAPLEGGGWGLPAARLGAGGLFGALAIGLGAVELQRVFVRRRWTIELPPSVPEAIGKSFAAIVPGFACVIATWLVVHVAGVEIVGLLAEAVRPLVGATDSFFGALAVVYVDSTMWLLGVHPLAALAAVKPLWLSMLAENMAAAADGAALPHVATREFFLWFVWQGGSGGTLGAALLLLRARSGSLRTVGRLGIVPSIFNVNEPLLFGLPIVMNPRLALPFLLTPVATVASTWLAMGAGLVARPRLEVLWTLPAPLGAYLATGGDTAAIALQLFNLGVGVAIWWPFIRRLDREAVAREGIAPIAVQTDDGAPPAAAMQL